MKVSLLKLIQRHGKDREVKHLPKVIRTKLNEKVISFIICLFIAFSLWVINNLSKTYTEDLPFTIGYNNFPQPKNNYISSDTIHLKVSSTGYRILEYKLGLMNRKINLNAREFRHTGDGYVYNITNHYHEIKIEEQLPDQVRLIDIAPDTVFIQKKKQ